MSRSASVAALASSVCCCGCGKVFEPKNPPRRKSVLRGLLLLVVEVAGVGDEALGSADFSATSADDGLGDFGAVSISVVFLFLFLVFVPFFLPLGDFPFLLVFFSDKVGLLEGDCGRGLGGCWGWALVEDVIAREEEVVVLVDESCCRCC